MYIVQFNNGDVMTVPSGEAKMWIMLSTWAINCNVYEKGGSGVPLCML